MIRAHSRAISCALALCQTRQQLGETAPRGENCNTLYGRYTTGTTIYDDKYSLSTTSINIEQ